MKITNIEFDGIDHNDYPDYCDVFIVSCDIDGKPATDEEVEVINKDAELVYNLFIENL